MNKVLEMLLEEAIAAYINSEVNFRTKNERQNLAKKIQDEESKVNLANEVIKENERLKEQLAEIKKNVEVLQNIKIS